MKNLAMHNITTLTDSPIRINPIKNKMLSIIIEILFPYLAIIGPTKNIGKYWPIMLKEAEMKISKIIGLVQTICLY